MAEVKMPLEELKSLEAKIEKQENEIQTLKDNQKKVIIHHKYYKGKVTGIDSAYRTIVDIAIRDNDYYRGNYREGGSASMYKTESLSLADAYRKGLVRIDFTEQSDEETVSDFQNLENIQEMIRKEETERFETRIKDLNDRIANQEYLLSSADKNHSKKVQQLLDEKADIIDKHKSEIKKLKDSHSNNIKAMKDTYNTEKKELEDEIEELKNNKKKKSMEQEIKELKAEIERLNNRGFWSRVSNK